MSGQMMMVSFCAVRLELDENSNDVDIEFNCNRTIEDLLGNLSLSEAARPVKPILDEKTRHRNRGHRLMSKIVVETIMDFGTDHVAHASKESTPGDATNSTLSSRESSKRSTKDSTPAGAAGSDGEPLNPDLINFVSGNPFVEVTKGILHLYKENQTTSLEDGVIRSQMICMLGVPAKLKTPDLLSFTAAVHSELEMMRVIHDGNPNQYMVLMRFRCQASADEFYQAFNGLPYNSLEPEDTCSLVYISKVETCKESEYYPLSNHTELPVCSICLERMDESVSTVLTILCNHTFHSSCLAQWEDATCPVCRYIQTPELVAEQRCSECNSSDDLWICLICGYVGCGRYIGGHSHDHFSETSHSYTMELGQTNRVWDYVGDNFVHRLLQTDGADGKLVAAEGGNCRDSKGCGGACVCGEEKVKSLELELYYTLTTQLDKQRQHYEEKMARLETNAQREMEEVLKRARSSVEEAKQMEAKVAVLTKDKAKAEHKLNQLNQKLSKVMTELKDERHLNQSLRQNQQSWQQKMAELEKKMNQKDSEVQELREQLRDMMFHFAANDKISQDSDLREEINGGEVHVSEASPSDAKSKGASRKKKVAK